MDTDGSPEATRRIVPINKIPSNIIQPPEDIKEIVELMKEVCLQEGGVGLSAVQIGLPYNIYLVKSPDFRVFVNCSYKKDKDSFQIDSTEGCLSLRNDDGSPRFFKLKRYNIVIVSGFELILDKLVKIKLKIKDFIAIVHQHEIDHAENILISDIGIEIL